MTILALYDTETNGLLEEKVEKDGSRTPPMDRVHCVAIIFRDLTGKALDRKVSAADQPGFRRGTSHYYLNGEPQYHVLGVGEQAPPGADVWHRMSIADALEELAQADIRVGHNVQDFDERALARTYPGWSPKKGSRVLDTLILSRFIYADIHRHGPNGHRLYPFEKRMHSLKAWGKRLGIEKEGYTEWCKAEGLEPWAKWRPEMQAYMDQDSVVGDALFKWLWAQKPSTTAVDLEHEFAAIIRRLESRGWAFDRDKAEVLLSELQAKEATLEGELIGAFGKFWMPERRGGSAPRDSIKRSAEGEEDEDAEDEAVQATRHAQFVRAQATKYQVIPTRTYEKKLVGFPDVTRPRVSEKTGKPLKDYVGPPKETTTQGHAYTPVRLVEFNPSSRAHIWQRLMHKYGWEPSKYTPGGKHKDPEPVVDEEVLSGLPYPEVPKLAEYFLILKRIGQLAAGQKAWLKMARPTETRTGETLWRIHGRINTNGAATGRCIHSNPNLAQVPKNSAGVKDYPNSPELHGDRCRDLFIATLGMLLAGFDGSGLELRMLAHYLTPWDKGEYARIVSEGRKEDGTDPHSWLRDLIGTDLLGNGDPDVGRDNAKTVMYADLYGAGNLKRGGIVLPKGSDREKMELGREIKAKMEYRFTAKAKLAGALEEVVEERGFIKGLDGRVLRVRKAHAALNTLLQSAGAVVMKKALVVLDADLQAKGLTPGKEYEFVGNIHDEAQAEILPEVQETYDAAALSCLPKAGKALGLLCPLASETAFGLSWKDTH